MHVLGTVRSHMSEPHCFKNRFKLPLLGRAEFNEFKSIKASGIFEEVARVKGFVRVHELSPVRINIVSFVTKYAKPVILSKRR
jgi:hypothetical protein